MTNITVEYNRAHDYKLLNLLRDVKNKNRVRGGRKDNFRKVCFSLPVE